MAVPALYAVRWCNESTILPVCTLISYTQRLLRCGELILTDEALGIIEHVLPL